MVVVDVQNDVHFSDSFSILEISTGTAAMQAGHCEASLRR